MSTYYKFPKVAHAVGRTQN